MSDRNRLHGLYQRYDNYDAIEVSRVELIPSDYDGVMGVPLSFLNYYCPDQFEIVGLSCSGISPEHLRLPHHKITYHEPFLSGKGIYKRMFIRHRDPAPRGGR